MLTPKNVLTPFQNEVLSYFFKIKDSVYFLLTGGSALAEFYLGHRKSFDLDIFTTEKELILPFSRVLEEEMKKRFSVHVTRRFETFVEFEIGNGTESIKLQLAYESPFRFEPPFESSNGIRVNDYKDLSTDKLLAFFGRAEPRDAIDIYFILQSEDFWTLVQQASQKDPGFDLYWLAIAMARVSEFPDDIHRWPVEMVLDFKVNELKKSFSDLTAKLMDKIKNLKK
jgi:hypothetical protein